MKTKKMLLSAAIALSTALTPVATTVMFTTPVYAEETTEHTIEINSTDTNAQFEAYQIFVGKNKTVEGTAVSPVLSDIQWGNGVTEAGKNAAYTLLGLTEAEDKTAAKVAEKLTDHNKRAFASMLVNGGKNGDAAIQYLDLSQASHESSSNNKRTISVTGDGYYLIKNTSTSTTDQPTEAILKVVNDITVDPKTTDVPDTEKKVVENKKGVNGNPSIVPFTEGHKINDVADYNIGDEVPFILAAQAPTAEDIDSYTNYVFTFHDKMDAGLTLKAETISVKAGDTPLTPGDDYTLNISPEDKDSFDITINIKSEGEEKSKVIGKKIVVEFKATLNSEAELNKVGNQNGFILEYTNNPNTEGTGKTAEDKVVVFTYTMEFNKVDSKNEQTTLTGAEFKLYKQENGKTMYLQATGSNGTYKVTGWTETESGATTLSSNTNVFEIQGLDEGAYKLKETKAPNGYNLPTAPLDIYLKARTINDNEVNYNGTPSTAIGAIQVSDTDVALDENSSDAASINVKNTQGTSLPETGGMGTTMLYAAGAIMVGGAAVLLVTNKRMKKQD